MSIGWKTTRTDEPLWPCATPVVLVVNESLEAPSALRGWALGSREFALAPQPPRVISGLRDVISPGGNAVFQTRYVELAQDEQPSRFSRRQEGVYRVEIATGVTTRASFERLSSQAYGSRIVAASPGGHSAVILDMWHVVDVPQPDTAGMSGFDAAKTRQAHWKRLRETARVGVWLEKFDGTPAQEVVVLEGTLAGDGTTSVCQWSPNGRYLALSFVPANKRIGYPDVQVFDTSNWQIVAQFEDSSLAGSASWGPDSDRLLIDWIDLRIQHLDGARQDITVLKGPAPNGKRPVEPLGMADNDHLLTVRAPGAWSTVMRTSIAHGTHEGIVTWKAGDSTLPVLAQMPPETWA